MATSPSRTRRSTALANTGRLPYESLAEEAQRMTAKLRGSRTGGFPGDTGVKGEGKTSVKSDANPKQGAKRQGVGREKPGDASAGATRNAAKARTGVKGAAKKPALRSSASRNGLPNAVDKRNAKLARAQRRSSKAT